MAMLNNQRVYIYTHSIHIDCIYWIEYRQCWLWTFLLGLWHVFFVSLFVTFQSYILEPYACHSVACFGLTSPFVELAHILPCTLGYSFFSPSFLISSLITIIFSKQSVSATCFARKRSWWPKSAMLRSVSPSAALFQYLGGWQERWLCGMILADKQW